MSDISDGSCGMQEDADWREISSLLLLTEPAGSGAGAQLLLVLSSHGNLSVERLGNVVWQWNGSPYAGTGVCRALI